MLIPHDSCPPKLQFLLLLPSLECPVLPSHLALLQGLFPSFKACNSQALKAAGASWVCVFSIAAPSAMLGTEYLPLWQLFFEEGKKSYFFFLSLRGIVLLELSSSFAINLAFFFPLGAKA